MQNFLCRRASRLVALLAFTIFAVGCPESVRREFNDAIVNFRKENYTEPQIAGWTLLQQALYGTEEGEEQTSTDRRFAGWIAGKDAATNAIECQPLYLHIISLGDFSSLKVQRSTVIELQDREPGSSSQDKLPVIMVRIKKAGPAQFHVRASVLMTYLDGRRECRTTTRRYCYDGSKMFLESSSDELN